MSKVTHNFLPSVSVRLREDGRYDVEIDWSQCYSLSTESGQENRDEGPDVDAACSALDAWVKTQPQTWIIGAVQVVP